MTAKCACLAEKRYPDSKIHYPDNKNYYPGNKNHCRDSKIHHPDNKYHYRDNKIRYPDSKNRYWDSKIYYPGNKIQSPGSVNMVRLVKKRYAGTGNRPVCRVCRQLNRRAHGMDDKKTKHPVLPGCSGVWEWGRFYQRR